MIGRHHWVVRVTHWVNAIALTLMVGKWLADLQCVPRVRAKRRDVSAAIRSGAQGHPRRADLRRMARRRASLALRTDVGAGDQRTRVPRASSTCTASGAISFRGAATRAMRWNDQVLPLRDEVDHPRQGKHNAMQKATYFALPCWRSCRCSRDSRSGSPCSSDGSPRSSAATCGRATGTSWRWWRWSCFPSVHVFMVFAVDPYSLQSMVTGGYRDDLSPEARNARPFYHLLPRWRDRAAQGDYAM